MLFSSLNTGSTDLRDTEVQQPNTTATLSLVMSSRAFSANSGQFEAGSTTTASSFLPRRPPFLFCSSMSMRTVSLSVVSLMAIVPESECRTPTLMVSAALATAESARPQASGSARKSVCLSFMYGFPCIVFVKSHLELQAESHHFVVDAGDIVVVLDVE